MFSDWWEEQIRLAVEKAKNGEYDGLCTCNCVDRRRFEEQATEQATKYNSLQAENERLTKENAELQKQVEELKDICLDCPYKLKFDEIEKQAVKDTAKEIYEWLMEHPIDDNFIHIKKHLKEKYGVEVE